jgi:predicted naringenin-chalcone synthase
MSYITSIGTAVPNHRFNQSTLTDFMIKVMKPDYEGERKLRTIFRSSGIVTRYSVLEDYGKQSNFSFYPNTENFEPFPSTEQRINEYRKQAVALSQEAINKCLERKSNFSLATITHLITVSCTGMYAPGLDIELVRTLGLSHHVQRTSINFMGCYAAFNAIKIANALCLASPNATVLIVCTELCSLHFQKEPTEDNFLANALFSDGSAAILMEAAPTEGWNLAPQKFHNILLPAEDTHMAWGVGNFGFEMKLSGYVPEMIKSGIKNFAKAILEQIEPDIQHIRHFAIHPGGKKILEVIEAELGISTAKNEAAYHVLNNFGNMSSATVLFVLDYIISHATNEDNHSPLLSFAFGPGLTLEGILFTLTKHSHA